MPAGEPGLHRLNRLAAPLTRRWIILAFALAVAGVALAELYRPDLQRLDGDDSIQIYLAQRALEGSPPYVAGLYAKTPLTPLLTAAAIGVGRVAGVSDIMSGRLLFVALGGLYVLAMGLAGTAIFGGRTWRPAAEGAAAGGLAAAATLLSFRPLPVVAAKGMEPKLILAAFGTLALWLTARRRWGWAGACAALAFLAWQPAGLFMAATALAALCQAGEPRWKAVGGAVLGMCAPLAAVGAYLAATGALGPAWRQAGLGALTFGQAAVEGSGLLARLSSNPGRIYAATGTAFDGMRPVFLLGLLGWLGLAAEPLRAIWQTSAEGGLASRLWEATRRPAQLPSMVVGGGFLAFTVLDFQAGPDLLPLTPLAALGIGWWLVTLSGATALRRLPAATMLIGVVVSAALAGLGFYQLAQRPMHNAAVQAQIQAAEQLYDMVGQDAEVQVFGCMAPLVIRSRPNATRFVHLGRKSLNLTAIELGGGVERLAAVIEERKPAAVLFDGGRYGEEPLKALIAGRYTRSGVQLLGCQATTLAEIWLRNAP
jgi:hypothetical protein